MDKETLSNYGWIVICVLVLAVMLALATPFGTFIADGFKATYTGLFQTGDNAMDTALGAVGVSNKLPCGHGRKEAGDHSQKECGHYNCQDTDCGCVPASCGIEGHWSGDGMDHTTVVNHTASKYETPHTYACQCSGWVVPEGGTYTKADGTVYNAGDKLPCGYSSKRTGDTYQFEDYLYTSPTNEDGWDVKVVDTTKTSYSPVLGSINDMYIIYLSETYKNCTALTTAPDISACTELKQMPHAFYGCTSLSDVSNLVIPSNVYFMNSTFYGCESLTTAPEIPSSVTNMAYAFQGCRALTGTISVPCGAYTYGAIWSTSAALEIYHVDGCDGSCGK